MASARDFLDSPTAVNRVADLNHGVALLELNERLAGVEAVTPKYAAQAIATVFGKRPRSISASRSFRDDAARVRDTLIASYLLARAPSAGKELVAAMRMIALVEAVAKQVNQDATDAILKGPMVLPDIVEQLRDPLPQPPVEPPPQERAKTLVREIEALHGRAEKLRQIMADLALHEVDELVVREGDEEKPLSALFLPEETEDRRPVETLGSSILARGAAHKNVFIARTAIERLPEDAMQTLRELGADPLHSALAEISQTITNQLGAIDNLLLKKHNALSSVGMSEPIETELIFDPLPQPQKPIFEPVNDPDAEDPPWSPAVPQLPTTHGTAKPLGVADLLLVKHQLLRYERGEVSFVENALGGEQLTHTVRTAQTEEVALTTESEESDLRSEAQSVSHAGSGGSQAVAHGYGPVAIRSAISSLTHAFIFASEFECCVAGAPRKRYRSRRSKIRGAARLYRRTNLAAPRSE